MTSRPIFARKRRTFPVVLPNAKKPKVVEDADKETTEKKESEVIVVAEDEISDPVDTKKLATEQEKTDKKIEPKKPDPLSRAHTLPPEEEIEKELYKFELRMKESNDREEYIYTGLCGIKRNKNTDDEAIVYLTAPRNYQLFAQCYTAPGIMFHSTVVWPHRGFLDFTIYKGESIYCQRKCSFDFPPCPTPHTFEIGCLRTKRVILVFSERKLSCVKCILEEQYSSIIKSFKANSYPHVTPPPIAQALPVNAMDAGNDSDDMSDSSEGSSASGVSSSDGSDSDSETLRKKGKKRKNGTSDDLLEEEDHSRGKKPIKSSKSEEMDIPQEEPNTGTVDDAEAQMVFTPYVPKRVPIHCAHPAKIVESTTLAGAELPPLRYEENLPDVCTKMRNHSKLSSVQLETVKFVGLRHQSFLESKERAGYFIGDGTGVGKGRQIAAIIADNYRQGRRRAIWISSSSSLIQDSQRDLDDIGADDIQIFSLANAGEMPSEGVMFLTYSLLIGKGNRRTNHSRYDQIIHWVTNGRPKDKNSFEGPLIFDEAHCAKNFQVGAKDKAGAGSSQTAKLVDRIQKELPSARVVYVSATGASDPRHMAYMRRLGLWGPGTPFEDFNTFKNSIGDSVGAMEMVAMEMKSLGMYCSRHLSFEGTKFDLENLSLTPKQKTMYNESAKWWQQLIFQFIEGYSTGLLVGAACGVTTGKKVPSSVLWGAHQRFFLQLCIAVKTRRCIELTREALKNNYAVVIGLFTTGEAVLDETLSKSMTHEELLSAPHLLAETFVNKWFPNFRIQVNESGVSDLVPDVTMTKIKEELLAKLHSLQLPDNPIDELIHTFGGPSKVAEVTGRSNRLVMDREKGKFMVDRRVPKKDNNIECDAFMRGRKKIAIISEAASTGISLHASVTCKNQLRRMHIVLQLPWSAEKAVQQLGRTHRSYQTVPPHYKLLISEIGGERRLASVVALRLGALGALTSGDRRATSACEALSEFVISGKYGSSAIDQLENDLLLPGTEESLVAAVAQAKELGALAMNSKGTERVKRFLNRILGLTIENQRAVFLSFIEHYDDAVRKSQMEGTYDDGIFDILGEVTHPREVIFTNPRNPAQKTYCLQIEVTQGVSWAEALALLEAGNSLREKKEAENKPKKEYLKNGFYENKRTHHLLLAIQLQDDPRKYHIVRPHLGHISMPRYHSELKRRYKVLDLEDAKTAWDQKYFQEVKSASAKRKDTYGIITGSILPTCEILRQHFNTAALSIVRALCTHKDREERVVGILVNAKKLDVLKQTLRDHEQGQFKAAQFQNVMNTLEPQFKARGEQFIRTIQTKKFQTYLTTKNSKITLAEAVEDVKNYLFREHALLKSLLKHYDQTFIKNLWPKFTNLPSAKAYLLGTYPVSPQVITNELVKEYSSGAFGGTPPTEQKPQPITVSNFAQNSAPKPAPPQPTPARYHKL